ncbi:MAG: ABC transporter permease [Candidatus Spechtbacterales bacterium]
MLEQMGVSFRKSRIVQGIWRKKLARFALISILLFYLVGFVGFLDSLGVPILPYDPTATNISERYMPPSLVHPFGTDILGRDIMVRAIYAMTTSSLISLMALLGGGIILNITLSLVAGYYGGTRDSVIVKVGETLSGVPSLILMIVITASIGPSYKEVVAKVSEFLHWEWLAKSGIAEIFLIFVALSLIGWAGSVFMLRSRISVLREQGFVESSRALGASDVRIMFWHILPNLMGLIVLSLSGLLIGAIGTEIGLSYLGLGVKAPNPSFGVMFFSNDISTLQNHAYIFIPPAVIVTWMLFVSWMAGDALVSIAESKEMPQGGAV